jgi:hypothetical protein
LSAWQTQGATASEPKIVVLDGDEGVNVVKKKIAVSPVVEVRDQNDLPIAGAAVVFSLPKSGPGGLFANGTKELSLVSDPLGRAAMGQLRPSGKGAFQITVRATYKDRTATAAISQTNFSTVASAVKAGKTPGSSVSSAPTTANIALPPYGMAMSGGTAALMVVGLAAAGGAAYFLLKNKPAAASELSCVASSLASSLQADASTAFTDCSDGSGACATDGNTVQTALAAYCSCAPYSSLSSTVQSLVTDLGLQLPSACTGN